MAPKKSKPSRSSRSSLHRSSASIHNKTEIKIHVYDLLPPGKLSSTLWALGTSLLHSGVVINGKEYAYGGHDRRGVTGVYWTKPGIEPPGGIFKCEILHGFTFSPQHEIDAIIRAASEHFLGTAYNLLTKNCNHFTQYLCQKLTDRPGPGWLNRAASIGVALPCIVPRDWVEPPDCDLADGELLADEDHDEDNSTERSRMLRNSADRPRLITLEEGSEGGGRSSDEDQPRASMSKGQRRNSIRDTSGRQLPAAERAPASRVQLL
ncbi:hypothetical protein MCOR27_001635 [Pyricularia oryzae]|uniref:PPPDE domain-containing protein n=2 Tax=Pyricularia TaxID=48558 RepID=A0ABQ8N6P1_PYRGI|nr:hypothetical protein MCOR01_011233 [Pyricularia oryzae]KAI6291821.1 hypothetical protein MCOR33_010316 [Pyricularia grisea]KAH9437686.1 hypothetical protein MCOR02_001339 [Pyricularia oryzae]KAI6256598.1 hypothetical protein MCOR19_006968 [Pyricularia oryzae]KAI6265364.1 hypothetical protein MCOR26_010784 [Pyricularia oryzae]